MQVTASIATEASVADWTIMVPLADELMQEQLFVTHELNIAALAERMIFISDLVGFHDLSRREQAWAIILGTLEHARWRPYHRRGVFVPVFIHREMIELSR